MSDREVRVRAGNCPCPGKPHKFETITLRADVSVPMGIAAYAAIEDAADGPDIQAVLGMVYLHYGIEAWTFLEETGDGIFPVPITRANVDRLIGWNSGAAEVAKAADARFSKDLFRPLAERQQKSSGAGQTASSMPPTPPSGSPPPRPLRRSSHNGTAGKPSEVPAL